MIFLIVWSGTETELQSFFDEINQNIYGITFSGTWNQHTIDYLDLQLYKNNEHLETMTFTDMNGYIPTNSCHHISKGQLMRMYRNCSNLADYNTQADTLIERFVEKGYKKKELVTLKENIKHMDRNSLIEDKVKENRKTKRHNGDMPFITGFNIQHKALEKIIKKHWPILQSDQILRTSIPSRPSFIYRKAPKEFQII